MKIAINHDKLRTNKLYVIIYTRDFFLVYINYFLIFLLIIINYSIKATRRVTTNINKKTKKV